MADKVSFSTSRNSGQEEVSRASEDVSSPDTGSVEFSTSRNTGSSQSASDATSASSGDSVDTSSAGGPVNISTSRNGGTQQPASDATSVSSTDNVTDSSADSQATSADTTGGPVNISTSRNTATEQPASDTTAPSASENTDASSADSQAASTDTAGGAINVSTSRNATTEPTSDDTAPSASENTDASSADSQSDSADATGETVNISTSRNNTSSADTGTELSTASDTIGADSDGLEKLLTGLTQFCENLAQAIDKFMPEASDERFKELENGALKDTGITAQNIIDTAQGVSTFLRGLAEISEDAVNDMDAIDTPSSTSTSATKDNVSFNMDDVIDDEDDDNTDTETTTQEDTEVEATSAEESTDTAETDDITDGETTFSTSRNEAEEAAAEATDLRTESATATAEQATEGRHLSDDTSTTATSDSTETATTPSDSTEPTTNTTDTPLKAQAAAETSLSAESGTPASHVPDSSPVATSGPTKSAGDVINTPDSGPARDVLRSNAPAIKETYPDVPISDAKQKQIAAELMGQNSGTGSKQPVDTIHLTDQQVRTLAEAIAHNINLRRQAMAEQMMSQIDMGSVDSFGGGGAGFQAGELSNDYQQAVVELAEQIVGTQPPIPYAWGGGTLEGPSQGISDGGGYADACGDYNKIGFDCSGLVRYMFYQLTGVELPRVSQAQFEYCQPISDPMPGDIGFPAGGSPGHVFMYVGNGEIIEAQQSGTVMMFSPADASYVWGRPPESPNWDV